MSLDNSTQVRDPSLDFLAGGGDMGARMRAHPWESTPFGPPSRWPQSLRSALSICLGSSFQIAIYWGPELALLYNDAWSQIPGQKHPWALGRPGREVWPEIWDTIGPMFARVLAEGEATRSHDQLLAMHRRGFTEECYFDYTFSPIRDEAGGIGGIFNIAVETTFRVIGERRTRLLKDLGELTTSARTAEEACALATAALSSDAADLPFCLVYLSDAKQAGRLRLAGAAGLADGGPASPPCIDLADEHAPWPLARALETRSAVSVQPLAAQFGVPLAGGPWPESCERAFVVPLPHVGGGEPAGALVVGISPRLAFDIEYQAFVDRVAGLTATAIANARAYEQERRRAEALAELDRAKTAFFSNVSHEFRTPLTLMLGPVEDILAKPAGQVYPANRELLTLVHRSGLRLQRLVNTLLDFSRIEAGRAQASYEPTDLAAFTAELASSFRSTMERAGLRYTVECRPLSRPVYLDREMWEKVVLNLLSNAFKYTLEGAVTVHLVEREASAELTVTDTGTGIPEQEIPRLFERFHRVEGARGRTQEGTGIGLALVHELVRLHGGAVSVVSVLGQGSTFTVSLPFGAGHLPPDRIGAGRSLSSTALRANAYVEEALRWLPENGIDRAPHFAAAEIDTAPGDLVAGAGVRSRILLADDNADMREYVRRLLSPRYDVIAVGNGEEALAAALAQPPDLVLTDIMMPLLDGFGLLQALRDHERTKTLPILLLSARAGEESRVEGLNAGADDYLTKPFTARELLARVDAHLSLARMRRQADQARRLSEVRLGLALDATGLLAWHWDPVTDELKSIGDMPRIFGAVARSAAEAFGFLHPDDVAAHRAKVERVAREGGSYHSEFRIRRADTGAMSWLEERATGITEDGRVVAVVGVIADVSERKQAEAQLRHQWQTFDTALSNTPDLLCNFDLRGRFTYANRALLTLWQQPLEAILGKNTFDLGYPPELAERLQRQVQDVIATRQPVRDFTPFAGASGEARTYEYIFAPVLSESGSVEAVSCSARDITERERMEQALAASRERLHQIFQQAPVAIVVFRGADYVVELANPHYQALFQGRDLVGRRFFVDVVPDVDPRVRHAFDQVMNTGEPFVANDFYVPYDQDGDGVIEDHWFNVVYHPLRESDASVSGLVAVCSEVTVQVLARKEVERVNRELEEFAYVASHDLQEPLRMVNIFTQQILRRLEGQDPELEHFAGFVRQGVARMQALIQDLLTYSRTVQRNEVRVGTADLAASLGEAMSVLRNRIEESGAVVNVPSLPLVQGDTAQLAHVFQNLLSNALKYRKPDTVPEISITAEQTDGEWIIAVSDNGIGFEQKYAERIFGLFKRLHKDEYPGTGLGLAICQRIVERCGGRMWAAGSPGVGATFYFALLPPEKH